MKQEFAIQGMSCDHCVLRIEQAIQTLPGVKKVKVKLKKEQALVTYAQESVSPKEIIQKVEEAGYGATLTK